MELKEEKEIHKGAQDVINQLAVILRTAQIHDPGNIAVMTAVERFLALANLMMQSDSQIKLEVVGEFFYLNDTRVRYPLEYLLNFDFLIREFKKREIGRVVFRTGV
ncbi:MAG: hypothetical protein AB1442_14115, partial [Nitrospirota bacterium]